MKTKTPCIPCIPCIVCIVCIACIVCIPKPALSQISDDFSDGNFSINPAWEGDTAHFKVTVAGQLQLQSAGSDTSVLATACPAFAETEWCFWLKLSFNTSSNNHARVYLASDSPALLPSVNGIYLQAGGSDDSLLIVKKSGALIQTIFRFKSYKTAHSSSILRFRITHDGAGHWSAQVDTTGGYNYIADGDFYDGTSLHTGWFGVMCRYTSSNAAKFWFDDVYIGPVRHDTVSPWILRTETESSSVVNVFFSEPVQRQSAEVTENYRFLQSGTIIDSVRVDPLHPDQVAVFLRNAMPNGTLDSLQVINVRDLSGNRMTDDFVQVFYYLARLYDILINEIMPDPDPPVGLPDAEFIELFNRSEFPVNLQDWNIRYGSYTKVFPAVIIPPKGFLLVVKESAYCTYGACAVLLTSSSSLSNEGTTLVLSDKQNHVIHTVTYNPDWYQETFKEEGGWSLEMADPLNPCGCQENWEPSRDFSGGTPGRINATNDENPDAKGPYLKRAAVVDSATVEVVFSESMDSTSLLSAVNWWVVNTEEMVLPKGIFPVGPGFSAVKLMFDQPFEPGVVYRIGTTVALKDCAGNAIDTLRQARFALPEPVEDHDVVINEVLTNPASGGARFAELYNRSGKVVDLQNLVIAGGSAGDGYLAGAEPLVSGSFLLFPDDYIVFTSNPDEICSRYRPVVADRIEKMDGFPVLGDDTGTVVIARKADLLIIDMVRYNQDMHYPLLTTTEGVSLERSNPDLPSEDAANWHSASETSGFGTPGYQNSHFLVQDYADADLRVFPDVFSPDNDGRDDLLSITLANPDPDMSVSMTIYDGRGRLVRILVNNLFAGNENIFIWDGITETGSKAPIGFYILLAELTRAGGQVERQKKVFVLAGKFNQ